MHHATKEENTAMLQHKPMLPLVDQLLEAGLNASGMPAILFAPDDEIAYISDAYRDLIGVPEEAESFQDLVRFWHANQCGPQMLEGMDAWYKSALAMRRKEQQRTYEMNLADGRWFLVTETVVAGGWIWNFLIEITGFKTTEQELEISRDLARQDAETDALTGIFNRRFALDELDLNVRLATKTAKPLTVAIIDLDNFKVINDSYGHDAGDEVLSHFALTSSWLLRRTDTLARFGGEEFLLIMPGATTEDALAIVERIRREIVSKPMPDPAIDYTFSCGVATFESGSAKALLKRADEGLYQAKADGRNCTRTR